MIPFEQCPFPPPPPLKKKVFFYLPLPLFTSLRRVWLTNSSAAGDRGKMKSRPTEMSQKQINTVAAKQSSFLQVPAGEKFTLLTHFYVLYILVAQCILSRIIKTYTVP